MSNQASEVLEPDEFLVCYDYGMGGLWGVLVAPSRESIAARFPELDVVDELPRGLTSADVAKWREAPLRLDDDPPQGLLKALVADRARRD